MTHKQYENRIRKLAALESEKHAIQVEIDRIKEEIIAGMDGAEMIETDRVTIRNSVIISNRFDTKSFKADHEKLYTDYLREAISTRFTYKIA